MSQTNISMFGLPSPGAERADVLLLPLPVEKTVSYGVGTATGPAAIVTASPQVETFDEETLVDFAQSPRIHVLPPLSAEGDIEACLARIQETVRPWRGRFLVSLGGEHTVTFGTGLGLAGNPADVTIVHIDAHADLADTLGGRHWSHGTVMRRLWERGCSLLQIGIRSLTREEYDTATAGPRIVTYYAHRLDEQWDEMLAALRNLKGNVYLSLDVDGLDPSIMPSTGTPQPGGLSWRQMMQIFRVLFTESRCRLLGADVVEFVASPTPPGCDPVAARLTTKLLAWWWKGEINR
jgi:agmatinase